jgi:hypothetical protein
MDYATVLQIAVAIAMLCVLLVALWPKLSCELSDSEQKNFPRSRRSVSAHVRVEPGRYAGSLRHTYQRLFGRKSYPETASERPIDPAQPEDGPADDMAA